MLKDDPHLNVTARQTGYKGMPPGVTRDGNTTRTLRTEFSDEVWIAEGKFESKLDLTAVVCIRIYLVFLTQLFILTNILISTIGPIVLPI